jgi:hypothetical protein
VGEQPPGLGDGERDHAGVGGRGLVWECRGGWLGAGAAAELGGGDGADGQGGHDQHGVPGDGGVEADLGLIEPEAALRGRHTLRGFDRLPAEVELTNPRHPLAGRRVPVLSAYRRNGGVWLVVMLPDGFPAPVRVGETDLGGPGVAATGTTIFSVAGIRRLRELAAGVAAKDRVR